MKRPGSAVNRPTDAFFHSIRFRLVMWFVLILGVVMAIFSGFIYWRQQQDVRSIALGRLNMSLESLVGRSGEGEHGAEPQLYNLTGIPAGTPVEAILAQDGDITAIQDTSGAILQSAGALTTEQIQQIKLPSFGWTGVYQAAVPKYTISGTTQYLFINPAIENHGVAAGYLLLGVPLDANNQMGRLLISLVIGNLLTLAAALAGGFWLADRAMRPVHTITQTAREIGETDLHKRLHLPGRDELSELGNTFDAMLDRLQAAFERQRQFTADASHELRTPLTIIDLETNRGLSNRRSPGEYESILGTIQAENKQMIRLVNNLLALARMDAGQVKLKTEPIDLGSLVSEVIERMEPLATAQGVTFSVGVLPEVMITGDQTTLTQMLTNLVENAIKYSCTVTQPTVSLSVGVSDLEGEAQAWVRVCDNGIGISSEHQAQIFSRFYQVDLSRSEANYPDGDGSGPESSGTGLGLAISQWIAQAHHGEIRVESVVGKGSTFEVILPAGRGR